MLDTTPNLDAIAELVCGILKTKDEPLTLLCPKDDPIIGSFRNAGDIFDVNAVLEGEEAIAEKRDRLFAACVSKGVFRDWADMDRIIDGLTDSGRAAVIMPSGILWKRDIVRVKLVERGLIEMVIALPPRILDRVSLASLVVFNRGQRGNGNAGIRMVDATAQSREGRRLDEMTAENVRAILDMAEQDGECSCSVKLDSIREKGYVLRPRRYLRTEAVVENGVPLRELLLNGRVSRSIPLNAAQLDGMTSAEPTKNRYLKMANVHYGVIDRDLPYLKEIEPNYEKYCLTHSKNRCVVLSKFGMPYKAAVVEVGEGENLLTSSNLYVLRLDESRIDPWYVAAYFNSRKGQEAIAGIEGGMALRILSVSELETMQIPFLPEEEQRRIAGGFRARVERIVNLQNEMDQIRREIETLF